MGAYRIINILIASSVWIVFFTLYVLVMHAKSADDGTGSQMGWYAVGKMIINTSVAVSFFISAVQILIALYRRRKLYPKLGIDNWLYLLNFSFIFYFSYMPIKSGVTVELFLKHSLPVIIPHTILLLLFLYIRHNHIEKINFENI